MVKVKGVVTRLFIVADEGQWNEAEACFATKGNGKSKTKSIDLSVLALFFSRRYRR